MYYGDYGNYESRSYDRTKDYDLYQIGKEKIAAGDAQSAAKAQPPLFTFNRRTEVKSTDALGTYGKAFLNMGQKNNPALVLPLTDEAQAMVGRYNTPEQQARVSENMLGYFG